MVHDHLFQSRLSRAHVQGTIGLAFLDAITDTYVTDGVRGPSAMELYALQPLPSNPWILSSDSGLFSFQRSLDSKLGRRFVPKMSYQCYANNGSLYENTAATYVPCNLTAVENGGHSSCCNINDLCMTNGLCMEAQNEKKGANHYWRNGCTDPTFKDPACPNFCRGQGMYLHILGIKKWLTLFCRGTGSLQRIHFLLLQSEK